jgi:protein-tyrosine phosphatase
MGELSQASSSVTIDERRQGRASFLARTFGRLCLLALLAAAGPLGCGSERPALDASEPVVERKGDALTLRWSGAPAGEPLPIYAGPAPDRIDRATPIASLVDGRARITRVPFEGRPFLELTLPDGSTRIVAERLLPFDGAEHFRDLGGYPTSDGRSVRWGRAYRSGQLAGLSDEDVVRLAELGLGLVVDFRSDKEREHEPDRLPRDPAPRVVLAPITTPGVDPHELREKLFSGELGDLDLSDWLVEGNRRFVLDFADHYRRMFDAILEAGSTPFVVHCTGGKDRAGMASALILLALGVPEDRVMEDFLLTNHFLADVIEQRLLAIRVFSLFRTDPEQVRPLMGVEARYLRAGLDAMRDKRGSIDAFLEADLGLDPIRRERLRTLLLEPERPGAT